MNKFRENLAKKIRYLRGKQSQSAFAHRLGISQSSLNRIEQGEQNITVDTLYIICKKLRLNPEELFKD